MENPIGRLIKKEWDISYTLLLEFHSLQQNNTSRHTGKNETNELHTTRHDIFGINVGDETLSRTEYGTFMGLNFPFKDQLFDLLDWNKNGVLSKYEFVDKPFVAADQNGIDFITKSNPL